MIYVISKETYGQYEVRDIQCNANWDCCPYSEYALIPENLLGDILATQGYCDIVLNDAGNEVVSFTAREIPSVPDECCGDNTVLSVNGVKANSNGELTLTHNDVGAVSRTLLWENASVTSEFQSNFIIIDSFYDYDGFEIVYYDCTALNHVLYSSGYLPMVRQQNIRLVANAIGSGSYIRHRSCYVVDLSLGGIQFGSGMYCISTETLGEGSEDNESIIPYRIYGIKGVRNADDPDPGSGGGSSGNSTGTTKPLVLYANDTNTTPEEYLNNAYYGDEALAAILAGRQILVKTPNASGDNYVASYSPVYMYQLPNYQNNYLYLFYLRDEKQDLSALLGQPAGTVMMPVYGQFKMLLSETYNTCPLTGGQ